jgi:hypothetical protein
LASRRVSVFQPDYAAWRAVQLGMTRDEVLALLGLPPKSSSVTAPPYVTYGWMRFRSDPRGVGHIFVLGFDKGDRVFYKSDPFSGKFSLDGKPSKPEFIIPQPGARFTHYPRVLDIRWKPCSGIYPMTYAMEIGIAVPGTTKFHIYLRETKIAEPYAVVALPGSQPGRVRVRARNEAGLGAWSDYRGFDFTLYGGGGLGYDRSATEEHG